MSGHVDQAADQLGKAAGAATSGTEKAVDAVVNINVNKVEPYVYCANCCTVSSIGLNYPECIGMSTEGIAFGCCAVQAQAFKPMTNNSDVVCLLANGTYACVKPGKTLCKTKLQTFCLEHRCAAPCDSETPCSCTICSPPCPPTLVPASASCAPRLRPPP